MLRSPIRTAAAVVTLVVSVGLAAPVTAKANAGQADPTTIAAPFERSLLTDACRQYDDVFGPDPVPVTDTLACTLTNQIADRATGVLTTSVDVAPAQKGGFGRGDAFPNSILGSTHRLRQPVDAVRYTFRFEVEEGHVSVSDPAQAFADLGLFARASSARCGCDARSSVTIASSMGSVDAAPGIVTLVAELRPTTGKLPKGDIVIHANLVPFVVIAAPPAQRADTIPSTGSAHVDGVARLVDITADVLP